MMLCPTCGGSGEVKHPTPREAGKVVCPTCGGAGQIAVAAPAPSPEPPAAVEASPVEASPVPVIDTTGSGDV